MSSKSVAAGAELLRFGGRDRVVGGRGRNHGEEVGEFLDDLVGRRDEVVGVTVGGLRVADEESA